MIDVSILDYKAARSSLYKPLYIYVILSKHIYCILHHTLMRCCALYALRIYSISPFTRRISFSEIFNLFYRALWNIVNNVIGTSILDVQYNCLMYIAVTALSVMALYSN